MKKTIIYLLMLIVLISFVSADTNSDVYNKAIHYWNLNDNATTETDLIGNGDLIAKNSPEYTENGSCISGLNGCYHLTASHQDYWNFTFRGDHLDNNTQFTVDFWAKNDDATSVSTVFETGVNADAMNFWIVENAEPGSSRYLSFYLKGTNTHWWYYPTAPNSSWKYYTLIWNMSAPAVYVYVNNVLVSGTVGTTISGTHVLNILSTAKVGARAVGTSHFLGWLDDLGVYNGSLTPTEMAWRFNNGIGQEITVSNNAPTTPVITSPYANEINNTRKMDFSSTDADSADTLTYSLYINDTLNITTTTNVTTWNGTNGNYVLKMSVNDGTVGSANSTATTFTLDTCAYSGSGDWIFDDGNTCDISASKDIGDNKIVVNNGIIRIKGSISIIANDGCYVHQGSGIWVSDSASLFCG